MELVLDQPPFGLEQSPPGLDQLPSGCPAAGLPEGPVLSITLAIELGVCAYLGYAARVVKHNDLVCSGNGVEFMGDDNEGGVASQRIHGVGDVVFVFGVQCAGGLVEENNGGGFEQGAGNGDTLTFSAR